MTIGNLHIVTGISTKGRVDKMKMKLIEVTDTYYKFLKKDSMGFIPLTFLVHNIEEMEDTGNVR